MGDNQIANLNTNGRESIRVAIREFRGCTNVDLRLFATSPMAELVPTRSGISIRPGLLRPIIDALVAAESKLQADGIIASRGAE